MRTSIACLTALVLLAAPLAPTANAGEAERTARLVAKLRTQRIANVDLEDVDLPGLVKWLRVVTGQNFVVKLRALAKADIEPKDVTFTIKLRDMRVDQLLKILLEPRDLAFKVKSNIVFITTKADSLGKPIVRLYGISHITWTKRDFIAPELSLRPDEAGLEEYEPEREVENDPLNNGDAVAELIQQIVLPEGWAENDWSITGTDNYLLVKAPRAVHAKIPSVLDKIASMK